MVNLGIKIDDSCIEKWSKLGSPKSTLKGCLLRLSHDYSNIELVNESDIKMDDCDAWKNFIKMLPEDACRFGFFDIKMTVTSGATNVPDRTVNKLVLITWIGPKSPRKERMIHTTSVMPLKAKLDANIVLTFHGHEDNDLGEIADCIKRKCGMNSKVVTIENVAL